MEAWIEIPNGKFLARTVGKEYGNVLLRKEQYRIYDNLDKSNLYARNMILGKVYNCRWSIERTLRDHEYRIDAERLKKISLVLKEGYERKLIWTNFVVWKVN